MARTKLTLLLFAITVVLTTHEKAQSASHFKVTKFARWQALDFLKSECGRSLYSVSTRFTKPRNQLIINAIICALKGLLELPSLWSSGAFAMYSCLSIYDAQIMSNKRVGNHKWRVALRWVLQFALWTRLERA